mmetsp:Transcript_37818/g.120569  ORF Transcript_37818/g.120569 Transcript_37818/m.120569 type:complete len:527 (-) Transcript_37818:138-1718(-)
MNGIREHSRASIHPWKTQRAAPSQPMEMPPTSLCHVHLWPCGTNSSLRHLLLLFLGSLLPDHRLLRLCSLSLFLLLALCELLTLSRGCNSRHRFVLLFLDRLLDLLNSFLHNLNVFSRLRPLCKEGQALFHLIFQLLAENRCGLIREAIDARGHGALVGEVPRDAALVLELCAANEGRVENQPVLRRVALRLQRTEERLLRAENLHRRRRVLREVRETARVRDQASTDDLADERRQVRSHDVHLRLQVLLQAFAHGRQLDDLAGEMVNVLHVHLDDVLAHRHLQCLRDLHGHLLGAASLHEALGACRLVEGVPDTNNPRDLRICDVVRNNLGQFREVPRIPFADTHRERVDVLVQVVQQGDAIDDGLILPVRVQLHAVAAEGVTQAEAGLVKVQLTEVLDELMEVRSAAPEQLTDTLAVGDGEACAQVLAQLGIVHTQLVLLLGLGQVQLQEVVQGLSCGASSDGIDLLEGVLGIGEGRPSLHGDHLAELLDISDGGLHLLLGLADFLELPLLEQSIACRAFVQQV